MAKEPEPGREHEERLAKSYLDKQAKGEKTTRAEFYAYRKLRKQHDAKARLEAFDTVTQAEWKLWSNRQAKIVNEQGRRYGAPFAAATFSIRAVARWLHDFLADNHDKLNRPLQPPVRDEIEAERLAEMQFQRAVRERKYVHLDEVEFEDNLLAKMTRDFSEDLQRRLPTTPQEMGERFDQYLDEYHRIASQRFAKLKAQQ